AHLSDRPWRDESKHRHHRTQRLKRSGVMRCHSHSFGQSAICSILLHTGMKQSKSRRTVDGKREEKSGSCLSLLTPQLRATRGAARLPINRASVIFPNIFPVICVFVV